MERESTEQLPTIEIYNIPQHANKQQISYFLWKTLQRAHALKKASNPILKTQRRQNHIQLTLRSKEEAQNCLDLNGIYFGLRSLYMKSASVVPRSKPLVEAKDMEIRRIESVVKDSAYKIYVGNLPLMPDHEIIEWLCSYGKLHAYESIAAAKAYSQCYCQFTTEAETENFLLNAKKIKDRAVIAKRTVQMAQKSNLFQKDISQFYLTLDTVGMFRKITISCVLLLQNLIRNQNHKIDVEFVQLDLRREMSKIGPIVRMTQKLKNVFVQYTKIQHAQIAYILLQRRKYDGKAIEITFYDPIEFSKEFPY